MKIDAAELDKRFTYHSPREGQTPRYGAIRHTAKLFAMELISLTPPSREQSNALTALDEVVFWANAAIARREVVAPIALPDPTDQAKAINRDI